MTAEQNKALELALGQIEKQFGKGSVMKMGEKGDMAIEAISTGALALDLALGIGGLPRGRVVEIYGPESSGKSTLAMHVVAEAQRNGGICAYIDAEHAMDPVYARAIGVDIDELLVSQPDTGEQALEIADMLIRSGAIDVVVIDSVAALTPKAEIEGDMGDTHVGLQARLMSQALRKLTANLNRSNTICVFINQLREKIGVMFGSPETTPGGRALKFYSSVRLDIRRIESIKDGAEVVGNRTRVKVVKNKVAPPFRQAEFDIMYGRGISREGSLLDVAVDLGLVKKSGAWFTYEGEQLGQGRENAKSFLTSNPEIMVEISERVRPRSASRSTAAEPRAGAVPGGPGALRGLNGRFGRQPTVRPRPAGAVILDAVTRRYFVRTYGCQMNEHDSERIAGPARGRRLRGGVRDRRGRRHRAQHVLHPGERRQQALRPPRPPEGAQGRPSRPADRGGRLPGPEGPRADPAPGAPRRRRVRHPQRGPGRRAAGPGPPRRARSSRSSTQPLDDAAEFPSALPVRREVDYAAWVTIQIGCDNSCAFCIVPACGARRSAGPSPTSSPRSSSLAGDGVVEVTLLGQNVNSYGRDLTTGLPAGAAVGRRRRSSPGRRGRRRVAAGPRPLFADLLRPSARWTASTGCASPAPTPRTCATT